MDSGYTVHIKLLHILTDHPHTVASEHQSWSESKSELSSHSLTMRLLAENISLKAERKKNCWRENIRYLVLVLQAGGYFVYSWREKGLKINPMLCLWAVFTKLCLLIGCGLCFGKIVVHSTEHSENVGEYTTSVSFGFSCSSWVICNLSLLASSQLLSKFLESIEKLFVEVKSNEGRKYCYKDVIQYLVVFTWLVALGSEIQVLAFESGYDLALRVPMALHVVPLTLSTILTLVLFDTLLRLIGGNVKSAIKETLRDCSLTLPTSERCPWSVITVKSLSREEEESQLSELLRLENIVLTVSYHGLLCFSPVRRNCSHSELYFLVVHHSA